MMISTGSRKGDGSPMLMLGVTSAEACELLAGGSLTVDTDRLDPRMPQLRVVLIGGQTEAEMGALIESKFPEVWRLDRVAADPGQESAP